MTHLTPPTHPDAIAIVGMAGRFASAADVEEFWQALRDGRELITRYDRDELLSKGVPPAVVDHPDYVPARGALADPLGFDAQFFGYSAREAELMDPQQRLILETAWHVAEDAGLRFDGESGRVGVFAATAPPTYLTVYRPRGDLDPLEVQLGNDPDFAAARISYKLGLDGPSIGVSTACSSGLTAVHLACQSLINGDSDVALALAASVRFPADRGLTRVPGSILSGDGHCRPFAADADGTVEADGAAGVTLRRLEDAIADGSRIHAVILGSAVGNDGSDRVGFTAPGAEGQRRILEAALRYADVDPSEVAYLEAHGTGTRLGDPVETRAVAAVYGSRDRQDPIRIGSLKSNLGHLNHVAGLAGLIKVALSLAHGQLTPSLHVDNGLNPELDLADGQIVVQSQLEPWPAHYPRRIAAVSSFGMGGSGVHAVLCEAPAVASSTTSGGTSEIMPLSAGSPEALSASASRLRAWLAKHPEVPLADVGTTLRQARSSLPYRTVVAGRDRDEIMAGLRSPSMPTQPVAATGASVLLFPGQGAEHAGMAAAAYAADDVFRHHLDEALAALPDGDRTRLRAYMLDPSAPVRGTALAQPALLALEYSQARAWMAAGLEVAGMIGHSIGELAAATLAGVFPIEDAMTLAAARGRLVASSGRGSMLAVGMSRAELGEHLIGFNGWDLAAHNSEQECVVAGSTSAIATVAEALRSQGAATVMLDVDHAFHSRLLDPLLGEYADVVRTARPAPPRYPYISCVTGTWADPRQVTSVDHWVKHLRGPVLFADAVRTALNDGPALFAMLGPGRTAANHARQAGAPVLVGADLPGPEGVAQAWVSGAAVRWTNEQGSTVSLPGYPFQHRAYSLGGPSGQPPVASAPSARLPVNQWFYAETFGPAVPALGPPTRSPLRWRVLGSGPIADALRQTQLSPPTVGDEEADLTVLTCETTDAHGRADAVATLLGPLWKFDGAAVRDLLLVTSASGTAPIDPPRPSTLGAAAAAAGRVLDQENPHLRVRCIDIAPGQDPQAVAASIAGMAVGELPVPDMLVAGRSWVRRLEPAVGSEASAIRRGGTYLILGGTGAIGRELANWLVSAYDAQVAVVARGARQEDSMATGEDGTGRVVHVQGDVTSLTSLTAAWDEAENKLGPIEGVIHAAGESATSAFSLVSERTPTETDPHFILKGVAVDRLAELVRIRRPSFVLGFSSLSVLLGGLGFAGYAAASAYMEARFAELNREQPDTRWATMRLDSWQPGRVGTGSAFRTSVDNPIRDHDAAALFERGFRLLSLGTASVSITSLPARIAEAAVPVGTEVVVDETSRHPRPPMATPYRAAEDDLEAAVISLLEELLHIDGIGADDDFFELGGHSLLAMKLAEQLASTLVLNVNLRTVFDAPTAARLATALETMDEMSEQDS